ncbi:MAG: ATP-binding cassette domain-containing protein, partial [Anaerolineae bacterium]|nr:ATP-binding cassette domain-containing protein [Anaerolineae bacterium]
MSNAIVRLENLYKYFGRFQALNDVSFEVEPGEVICIIGPSGSGKSTTLRCINFLEKPDFGFVEVDGLRIEGGGQGRAYTKKVHQLRLKTGMVFQQFNLFQHMSAIENVIEGLVTVKKMPKSEAVEIGE